MTALITACVGAIALFVGIVEREARRRGAIPTATVRRS
jgi:hypothetical protein